MHTLIDATAARSAAPKNDETETTGRSLGSWDQTESDRTNRSDETESPQPYTKRLASITAKLAIAGFELYPLTGRQLVLARWNMFRVLPSIEAAERFLVQIGGAK